LKHTQYDEEDILKFFQIKDDNYKAVTGVVLKNGSIYINDLRYDDLTQLKIMKEEADLKIEEEIVKTYNHTNEGMFFVIKNKEGE
jgi:hypothetical protein